MESPGPTEAQPDAWLNDLVKVGSIISSVHLFTTYARSAIVPLLKSSINTQREMIANAHALALKFENRVELFLNKRIDDYLAYLSVVLRRQRPSDFRPKDEDMILTLPHTQVGLLSSNTAMRNHYRITQANVLCCINSAQWQEPFVLSHRNWHGSLLSPG